MSEDDKSPDHKKTKVLSKEEEEEALNELEDAEEEAMLQPRKDETDENVLWLQELKDQIIKKQPTATVSIIIFNEETISATGLTVESYKSITSVKAGKKTNFDNLSTHLF